MYKSPLWKLQYTGLMCARPLSSGLQSGRNLVGCPSHGLTTQHALTDLVSSNLGVLSPKSLLFAPA
jgi:hypothetical protein